MRNLLIGLGEYTYCNIFSDRERSPMAVLESNFSRLFVVFIAYLSISLIFGVIYQALYDIDENNFIFSSSLDRPSRLTPEHAELNETRKDADYDIRGLAIAQPRWYFPLEQAISRDRLQYEDVYGRIHSAEDGAEIIRKVEEQYVKTGEWIKSKYTGTTI